MQSERLAQAVREQLEQSKQEMREQISGLSAKIQNYKDDYKEQMESDREAHRVDREFVIDVIDGMMPGGKERFAQILENKLAGS
jgi:signal transduction histidine kinase